MKHYKDYFKSRKEVEQYFGSEVFRFHYMCDNAMDFRSLNPVFLNNEWVRFKLSFYYDSGKDFFDYSSFDGWFDQFQLSEVLIISEETHKTEQMYFRKYVDYKDN